MTVDMKNVCIGSRYKTFYCFLNPMYLVSYIQKYVACGLSAMA